VNVRGPRIASVVVLALLGAGGFAGLARAEGEARAVVDRVAVRFFSPETGGTEHPRFITERGLAFEARLEAMSEEAGPKSEGDQAARSALDRHVVEEMLATLDARTGRSTTEDARLEREARADLEQRAGGEGPIGIAAEEEGMSGDEINAFFVRRARAAAYLDRAVTRFLHPSDEQLREVYRTSPHPFRSRPYEDVRAPLARWFVFERLKALEATFLQTARSRVTVVVVPR
jgi:hypothetical protein